MIIKISQIEHVKLILVLRRWGLIEITLFYNIIMCAIFKETKN